MIALAVALLVLVVADHATAWWPPGLPAWSRAIGVVVAAVVLGPALGGGAGATASAAALGLLWLLVRDRHPWEVGGLVVVAAGLAAVTLTSGPGAPPDALVRWWSDVELPALRDVALAQAVLAVAVVLFLLRPANAVVRIVLDHAGPGVLGEERALRGGRLLGPLERVLIFAMALAGIYGVLAVVVAAKGVLRFPEISRDGPDGSRAEYVLVGSFASWTLALLFVPLF